MQSLGEMSGWRYATEKHRQAALFLYNVDLGDIQQTEIIST